MLVVIDNYDSFTYNLIHFLGELGASCQVYRNDSCRVEEIIVSQPEAIVISPGPCTPDQAGICLDLIPQLAQNHIPLLGVCLGHQALAQAFGAEIIRAVTPFHGKVTPIYHKDQSVFQGLPNPIEATRYHSLIVKESSLSSDFTITARSPSEEIMGICHKSLPLHGVQFHPESISTPHGKALLANFLDIVKHHRSNLNKA